MSGSSSWDGGTYRRRSTWAYLAVGVLLGFLVLLVLSAVWFGPAAGPRPPASHWFGFFWFPLGFFAFLFVLWALFWGFRIVVWGFRPWYWHWGHPPGDSAARLARERYARGEINRDQFGQIMRDLGPPPR